MDTNLTAFYPAPLIYARNLDPIGKQIMAEDRVDEKNAMIPREKFRLDLVYDFLYEFGETLSKIFRDVLALQSVPDYKILAVIFLSEDRKLFVGTFMVLLSALYLFVFVNN